MTAGERQAASAAIAERLLQEIDWQKVRTVHCFETLHELGEVDTAGLLTALQVHYPRIQLYTSRRVGAAWRTVTLQGREASERQQFDVVLAPMLGFDGALHRIGYGGGYYDRLLAGQPHAHKAGLCFEAGKIRRVPAETHDVALDLIVTEQQTYRPATP